MEMEKSTNHQDAWSLVEGNVPPIHLVYRQISTVLQDILSSIPRLSAPQEMLTHVAQELEVIAAIIKQYPQRMMETSFEKLLSGGGDVSDVSETFDFDWLGGLSNAIAPRLNHQVYQSKVVADNKPIRFEGYLDRVDGKKVFVSGTCFYENAKTAECHGVWICPDFMNGRSD